MNAPIHKELPAHLLNAEKALRDVTQSWDSQILKELTQYIEVPAKSPSFDANWEANGYLDTVLRQTAQWIEAQKVAGLSLELFAYPAAHRFCFLRWRPHARNLKVQVKPF
jgi:hypothetical protein